MRQNVLSIIDDFIHPGFKKESSTGRKAKILLLSSAVVTNSCLIYTVIYAYADYAIGQLILLYGILSALAIIILLKKGGLSIFFLGNFFTVTSLIFFGAFVITSGGILSPILIWLVVIPVSGFLYTNAKWGYFWLFVTILFIIILFGFNATGHTFPLYYPKSWNFWMITFNAIGFTIYISLLLLFHIGLVDIYMAGLEETSAEILRQHQSIEKMNQKLSNVLDERNKALAKANEELDNFIYATSHNLRGPLASIIGLTRLALREFPDAENKEYIERLKKRANDMEFTLWEIRGYSQNKMSEVADESFSLEELFDEVVIQLGYLDNFEKVNFLKECGDDDMIRTDRSRLKTVMLNLTMNSIYYHDMEKTEPYVKISLERADKWVIVRLEDNGQGISKEHVDKIFQMFYRASEDSIGTGLGLYIVQEIMIKLSGKIKVTSSDGEGTLFTLLLPLKIN